MAGLGESVSVIVDVIVAVIVPVIVAVHVHGNDTVIVIPADPEKPLITQPVRRTLSVPQSATKTTAVRGGIVKAPVPRS